MNIRSAAKVLVIRTAGTNCDKETAFAFEKAGAITELVHINALVRRERALKDYHILAIPGGFSYGDDVASGKILANEIRFKLEEEFKEFVRSGRLIIGICNGFQVLVKAGFLPNLSGDFVSIEASLSLNDSAKFETRWVHLKPGGKTKTQSKCVWTKGMSEVIYLPVAHGEGKFIPRTNEVMDSLEQNGQIVFRYSDAVGGDDISYPVDPNGSVEHVAGICDPSGRVFGLMPHPERHVEFTQHPFWTRLKNRTEGDGLRIFRNGVEFASSL